MEYTLRIHENGTGHLKQYILDNRQTVFYEIEKTTMFFDLEKTLNNQKAVYVLINAKTREFYIGYTDDVVQRINTHNLNDKIEWEKTFFVTSEHFTLDSITNIEAHLIDYFLNTKLNSWTLVNKKQERLYELTKPSEKESLDEAIKFLNYNYGIKKSIENLLEASSTISEVFEINQTKNRESFGTLFSIGTSDFVLRKGSKLASKLQPGTLNDSSKKNYIEAYNKIIKEKCNENYILLEDLKFASSSFPALLILGRSANGVTEWKTKSKITLKEYNEKNSIEQ